MRPLQRPGQKLGGFKKATIDAIVMIRYLSLSRISRPSRREGEIFEREADSHVRTAREVALAVPHSACTQLLETKQNILRVLFVIDGNRTTCKGRRRGVSGLSAQ
jgi:hypothetical protein